MDGIRPIKILVLKGCFNWFVSLILCATSRLFIGLGNPIDLRNLYILINVLLALPLVFPNGIAIKSQICFRTDFSNTHSCVGQTDIPALNSTALIFCCVDVNISVATGQYDFQDKIHNPLGVYCRNECICPYVLREAAHASLVTYKCIAD